mmetsp:Transcript_36200/g.87627  ORF Transcript_36200/g.87627 Transcript_36200/m.87627 type:complete len:83 (-) Transcript_36200:2650-2898(-)
MIHNRKHQAFRILSLPQRHHPPHTLKQYRRQLQHSLLHLNKVSRVIGLKNNKPPPTSRMTLAKAGFIEIFKTFLLTLVRDHS